MFAFERRVGEGFQGVSRISPPTVCGIMAWHEHHTSFVHSSTLSVRKRVKKAVWELYIFPMSRSSMK